MLRRVLFTPVLVSIFVFAGTVLARQSPRATGAEARPGRGAAVQFLSALVKINTSNPPGNEIQAARYIKDVLAQAGIASEIFESAPGRANIVARLRGNGSKKPLLLMAHLDVVGVERDKWSVDPFGALVRDGFLYGRGAYDDKGMVAANLEVFLELHRRKIPLDRDVIFLAEAGEEGTPEYGIDFMIRQHWDKIESQYALNEGGMFHEAGGKLVYAGVSTTEKVPRGIKLEAHGSSGHGSMPRTDDVITHLGAAVGKVGTWQPPMRLNETTREYFARLASISSPEDAYLYTHLQDPAVQRKLRATHLFQNSVLRTSISPTIIRGGFRHNVIPAYAEAELDVRALPDEDIDRLMATLRKIIDDPEVEVVRGSYGSARPAAPPSSIHNEMFRALEQAQAEVFPEAITIPIMQTAATDAAQLRARGVQAYGIDIPITDEDLGRMHGNDERVSVDSLGKFVRYIYRAVVEVAASKP